MDDIKDVTLEPLKDSQFVKPSRMNYKQNGVSKIWDLVSLHESVSVIIFNTERQRLIVVKQFRPAVYYSGVSKEERAKGKVDTEVFPGNSGLTLELCAGIVDKTSDLAKTAKEEVLEECGYSVPVEAFEKVITYRSGVGVSGDRQTMFYVEVTDAMKVSQGGGLASEGEMIDVVEMTLEAAHKYLEEPEVNSPGGFLFALLWFFQNKAPKQNS
ncbi:uridine diphosphate glucose pyrophosphatase NUDT14-like [Oratosquilla oratoria]|uniref:uridine diphosphate glucose pyrophosphatase NUDT14-like n=1 Tax=Oratosquilla oratoria TaxID=337810 RepID=UPI003F768122